MRSAQPSKKSIFCLITVLLLGNFLCAQSISGSVTDSTEKPIAYANIIAKNNETGAIDAFTSTNESGSYVLNLKKSGFYIIQYSALSYKIDSIMVNLEVSKPIKKNIILKESITELNEVIVKPDRPITIKEDTIVYKVSTFLKGNEVVVEDILRNLPGITVDADGTVKIGEQEVEKIMVEGDDFFKKGYKLLSKNLNADIINQVEIYQKYSNNKILKGIEDSDKVALNLTLKEDRKVDWFGNLSTAQGYGDNYLYSGRLNLMRFGKKVKHYFLANANNIGESSGGASVFYANASNINEVGTIANNEFSNKLISLQGFNLSLKENRYNFNNVEMLSFNSIFKLSDKAKLKTNVLLDCDEMEFQQRNIQNFNTGTNEFINTESRNLLNDKFKFYTELDFDYAISKTKSLEIDSKFTKQNGNITNGLIFNGENNIETLTDNNIRLDNKAVYYHRLSDKNAFVYSARYIFEELPQDYNIDNFLYQDIFPFVSASQTQQVSNNKINVLGLEAHLLQRTKTNNVLEIKTGLKYRSDNLTSSLTLFGNAGSIQPNNYTNNLEYTVSDFFVLSKYKFQFGDFSINPKLELHHIINNKTSFNTKLSESIFFTNPSISLAYKINKSNKVNLNLNNNISNATLLNVFDNFVLQNFRTFSRGTGEFNQIEATNLNFNYSLGDWSSSFFVNFNTGYTKNHDFFSTNSQVQATNSQVDVILIEDRAQWLANLKVDQYLNLLSSNLKLNVQYIQSDFKNIVNSTNLRAVKTKNYTYGFELRSALDGFFNYHAGTSWQTNEIISTTNFNFTNNTTFLDLNINISNLNIDFKSERYFYGNLETNNTYYFFDIISKYNFKKKGLSLSFKALNIFNTQTFREVFISDISTTVNEYRLLPRYIMAGVDFRF